MARDIGVIDLPVQTAVSGLTLQIRVTGIDVLRVRLWLGAQLMRLAGWIIGCNVEVEIEDKGPKNGFPDDAPHERVGSDHPLPG